jgi:hypothetical protein
MDFKLYHSNSILKIKKVATLSLSSHFLIAHKTMQAEAEVLPMPL